MAKALFFNVPAYGHINPTLPLVQELTRRGETVIYYAMKEFQQRIESTGAQFLDYKEISGATGFDFGTENDPRSFNLIKLARGLIEFTDRNLPHLFPRLADPRIGKSHRNLTGKVGNSLR